MAGIYIPNMQMPNKCEFIYICTDGTVFKGVIGLRERQQIAHAIQISDHGRLIDADAYEFPGDLIYEPTIIEADTNKINKEE